MRTARLTSCSMAPFMTIGDLGRGEYFPPRLRRGLRRKVTPTNKPYRSPYIFPPTNTSTLARSSGLQVASPIRALVSPR